MQSTPHTDPKHIHYRRVIYCAQCGQGIENEMTTLDTRMYHVTCFNCFQCGDSLVGKEVRTEDEKNFDLQCYILYGANKCDICAQPITGENEKYVKIKGKSFHEGCYVCTQCGKSLRKKRYHQDGRTRTCQACIQASRFAQLPSDDTNLPSGDL